MTTYDISINGNIYQFKFGIGFMHELDKRVKQPVNGIPGLSKNIGFKYIVADLMDGSIDALIDVLDVGNMGQNPRLKRSEIEAYLEDDDTDVEALFELVLDFLSRANVCRRTVEDLKKAIEEAEEK